MLEESSINETAIITERLKILESQYMKLRTDFNEIIIHNNILSNKLTKIRNHLIKRIDNLEIDVVDLNQYGRRDSIEICNISEGIEQSKLETYVINFLKSIKVSVESFNIVAVHRLGKFRNGINRNVIVKFINRKDAYKALKNNFLNKRSQLQIYKKLYIIENLCPVNKKIFNSLYRLKKLRKLHDVWTYNGSVFMNFSEDVNDPIHVQLYSDIEYFMNEYLFRSSESESESSSEDDSSQKSSSDD